MPLVSLPYLSTPANPKPCLRRMLRFLCIALPSRAKLDPQSPFACLDSWVLSILTLTSYFGLDPFLRVVCQHPSIFPARCPDGNPIKLSKPWPRVLLLDVSLLRIRSSAEHASVNRRLGLGAATTPRKSGHGNDGLVDMVGLFSHASLCIPRSWVWRSCAHRLQQ